jgi:hypothetical protein
MCISLRLSISVSLSIPPKEKGHFSEEELDPSMILASAVKVFQLTSSYKWATDTTA